MDPAIFNLPGAKDQRKSKLFASLAARIVKEKMITLAWSVLIRGWHYHYVFPTGKVVRCTNQMREVEMKQQYQATPSYSLVSGNCPAKVDVRAGGFQDYRTFNQRPVKRHT